MNASRRGTGIAIAVTTLLVLGVALWLPRARPHQDVVSVSRDPRAASAVVNDYLSALERNDRAHLKSVVITSSGDTAAIDKELKSLGGKSIDRSQVSVVVDDISPGFGSLQFLASEPIVRVLVRVDGSWKVSLDSGQSDKGSSSVRRP